MTSVRSNWTDISEIGGLGGTRTPDALLRTEALYPLSYEAAMGFNRHLLQPQESLWIGLSKHHYTGTYFPQRRVKKGLPDGDPNLIFAAGFTL